MKKIVITLLFASMFCNPGYAQGWPIQIYLDFEKNDKLPGFIKVYADSTEQNNLWQVGHPSKAGFNNAFNHFGALMTDTINSYPVNNQSTFYIEISKLDTIPEWVRDTLTFIAFQFPYKLDTDTLHDFGRIEMSFNGGNSYFEITPDSTFLHLSPNDYKSSGTTGSDWVWITLSMRSFDHKIPEKFYKDLTQPLVLRFKFTSDSIFDNKEGWMIDYIHIILQYGLVGVKELPASEEFVVYPSPFKDKLMLAENKLSGQKSKIVIYDLFGRNIWEKEIERTQFSISPDIKSGIYILKVHTGNNIYSQKIIKL